MNANPFDALFAAPLPRLEIRNGITTLRRNGSLLVPLPPLDQHAALARTLLDYGPSTFRDFRIAQLRDRWPGHIYPAELTELEMLCALARQASAVP